MKIRPSISNTTTLSATLRNWLPLLQSPLNELEQKLKEYAEVNPYVDIHSNQETSYEEEDPTDHDDEEVAPGYNDFEHFKRFEKKNSLTDTIEAVSTSKKSLYDILSEQITDQLFPTPKSKEIANEIIRFINDEGFFEGDESTLAATCQCDIEMIEKVRKRFSQLEPIGIGAKNIQESFMFQLDEFDVEDEVYTLLVEMIENMHNLTKFHKASAFPEAYKIFKKFKNPPAIEYQEESAQVIPDIFVLERDENLTVSLNDQFYPDVIIEDVSFAKSEPFVKEKLKEAKDLIDAMNMRKATLYKIGLMIVEFQYDFFKGEAIKPLKLSDISEELGRNTSTISRAISNKYLACDRGIFPIKSFFSVTVGEDTSAKAIKDFIQELIKEEDHKKPLSDQKMLERVQEHFEIKMVRRTITKYREQLSIPTSGERKRGYLLKDA